MKNKENPKKAKTKKEDDSMPIRIDNDVREWILALKDAMDAPNASEALRQALLKAYPNIAQVAKLARDKKVERDTLLAKLLSENGDE